MAAFIAGVRVPHITDATDAAADASADDPDAVDAVDAAAHGEGGKAEEAGGGIDWDWAAPSVDGGELSCKICCSRHN